MILSKPHTPVNGRQGVTSPGAHELHGCGGWDAQTSPVKSSRGKVMSHKCARRLSEPRFSIVRRPHILLVS